MESLAELLATGRVKEAEELARKRLSQNSGDSEALLVMARVALVEGRAGEVESLLARASSKASPQEVGLLRAGVASLKGDWSGARGLYESLTRQPQASAEAWYGLGLARSQLGELPGAREALDKAVELNPVQASLRFELGRVLTLLQQPRLAVYHLVSALRLVPQDDRGYRVVADIMFQRGHLLQARRVLERGLRQAPQSALLREGLARLPAPKAPSKAPAATSKTPASKTPASKAPADASARRQKEEALIQQVNELMGRSRHRDALKLLREASEQGLRTVALKLMEADACEASVPPDVTGATRAYEEAIALDPEPWIIYSNMGLFILRQGGMKDLSRAIQVLEEARRRGPTRPEPVLNLALAYFKGGRKAEAVELATQLVRGLPPQHPLFAQAQQLVESQGR